MKAEHPQQILDAVMERSSLSLAERMEYKVRLGHALILEALEMMDMFEESREDESR